jgi:hypothetical protein
LGLRRASKRNVKNPSPAQRATAGGVLGWLCHDASSAARFKQARARSTPPAILFGGKFSSFEKMKRLAFG